MQIEFRFANFCQGLRLLLELVGLAFAARDSYEIILPDTKVTSTTCKERFKPFFATEPCCRQRVCAGRAIHNEVRRS